MFKRTDKFETLVRELKEAKLAFVRAEKEYEECRAVCESANRAIDSAGKASLKAEAKMKEAQKAVLKALAEE